MRPIDADRLLDFIKFDEKVIAPEEHTAKDIVMMIQTAPTVAPPPNDPLTLEELREMEGEPVYDWMGYEWFVIAEVTEDEVIMTDGTVFDIDEDSPNNADHRFCRRKSEEPGHDG